MGPPGRMFNRTSGPRSTLAANSGVPIDSRESGRGAMYSPAGRLRARSMSSVAASSGRRAELFFWHGKTMCIREVRVKIATAGVKVGGQSGKMFMWGRGGGEGGRGARQGAKGERL